MRRHLAFAAAVVIAAAVLSIPAAASAAAPTTPAGRTVTLVTGDRVTTAGDGAVRIERGTGRQGVQFLTHQAGGHQYVIPSDALALLGQGRLDRRLFDVTMLLEFGYDRRADLPLIVTYPDRLARPAPAGARVDARLSAVDGLAVRASGTAFWQGIRKTADVSRVWLDGRRKVLLDASVPQIGAPAAWQAGYDGTGMSVAVLDTGIDATHPDLAGQVVAQYNFTEGAAGDADRFGHGTHVASTVAGTGAASGGRYRGVAPGARLLDGKVCDDNGDCADSWILAGMQWAAEQGVDVVNVSLGGPDTPEVDPIEAAVNALTEEYGILFVIAAGNDGQDMTINSPGSADRALTVGAVDGDDAMAWFSSRGPRAGDGAVKPDITAPGVDITAARSKDFPHGEPGSPYLDMSGTSMATPHVAGAAAILAQRHPDWPAQRLKAALMGSAQPTAGVGVLDQGAGRVDAGRVIDQTVTADPPSVSFGNHPAPHDNEQPVARTVSYANHGDTDVTVSVSTTLPADMFTVDRTEVTVPAGGQVGVTVTADPRVPAPVGQHAGYLVATAGDGTVVRTPVAMSTSPPPHYLTINGIDRAGQPTSWYSVLLVRLDGPGYLDIMPARPATTVQVPPGRYALMGWVTSEVPGGWHTTLLAQPRLDLTDQDPTIDLDARLGRPLAVSVPQAGAGLVSASVGAEIRDSGERYISGTSATSLAGLATAQIGPDTTDADTAPATFTARITARFAEPSGGTFDDSPYAYHLAWFSNGRMPTGLTRAVSPDQLATVHADHARHGAGGAVKYAFAVSPGRMDWQDNADAELRYPLPFRRTEYVNADGAARWVSSFAEDGLGLFHSQPTRYKAGHRYTERWNRGVFGPSVSSVETQQIGRIDDFIFAEVPLFGDGAGRSGSSSFTAARIALYRDGELVEERPFTGNLFAGLPAEDAGYRLEASADRSAIATLSTRVSATWTFRSAHVDGPALQPLPLSAVVFNTGLDAGSAAAAGRAYRIPVQVVGQPGSTAGPVRRLSVAASFDDGATWRRVPVTAGVATVSHPAGTGFVSLRARSADTAGNTVEQTIVRAYRFG